MVYFNCPHCHQPYDDQQMLEQEQVLIEDPAPLHEKKFDLICDNCLDSFSVTRQTTLIFYPSSQ